MLKGHQIVLKRHSIIKERHIQNIIVGNPAILGLEEGLGGDLTLVGKEMEQEERRRVDLLFQDQNLNKIYEVEIQLGPLDESHLLRAVGYWNIERKKSPCYEHTAVIISENIKPRISDLIELLKGIFSVIVLKMTAFEKENGIICLNFEKIYENKLNDTEDNNDYVVKNEYKPFKEPDRDFWENKVSRATLMVVDEIYHFLKEIDSNMKINYTEKYIGFKKEYDDQFVFIEPRCTPVDKSMLNQSNETNTKIKVNKESDSFVFIEVKKGVIQLKLVLEKLNETEIMIEKADLDVIYDPRKGKKCGQYVIGITEDDLKNKEPALKILLHKAYKRNIKN